MKFKQTKRKAVIPIATIIVLLIAAAGIGYLAFNQNGPLPLLPFSVGTCDSSLNPLSLSQYAVVNGEGAFTGKQMVSLLGTINGGSSCAMGTVSDSFANYKVSHKFSLSVSDVKQSITYPTTRKPTYDAYLVSYETGVTQDVCNNRKNTGLALSPDKQPSYPIIIDWRANLLSSSGTCVYAYPFAQIASLTSGKTTFSATNTLSVEGVGSQVAYISDTQTSANFGSYGYVKYAGTFIGTNLIPSASDLGVYLAYAKGANPYLVDKTTFDAYVRPALVGTEPALVAAFRNCYTNYVSSRLVVDGGVAQSGAQSCISQTDTITGITQNGMVNRALAPYTLGINDARVIETTLTISNGNIVMEADGSYYKPAFSYQISADTIGIFTPAGYPKITGAQVTTGTFGSSDSGVVSVTVTNQGTQNSDAHLTATCDNPLFYKTGDYSQMLPVGSSFTKTLYFGGQASSATTATCTIKTYDGNAPQNKDSKTVSFTVTAPVQCYGSESGCSGNSVWKCVNGIKSSGQSDVCQYGCDIAQSKCNPQPTTTTDTGITHTGDGLCLQPTGLDMANPGKWFDFYACQITQWFVANQIPILLGLVSAIIVGLKLGNLLFGITAIANPLFWIMVAGIFLVTSGIFIWIWSWSVIIGWVIAIGAIVGTILVLR